MQCIRIFNNSASNQLRINSHKLYILCFICIYRLTIRVTIIGRDKDISFVHSIKITVRLIVILTTPPRKAAAPINENVPR